jgi:GTP cyclohydrolase I
MTFAEDHPSVVQDAERVLSYAADLDYTTPHGARTAERFVDMLKELTTPTEFKFTTFPNEKALDEMVIVRDIPFVSLCNHHVVPFYGYAHVGYVPDQLVAGLSKFARAVKYCAASLHVQEELTVEIADFLEEQLNPKGLAVLMEAEHLCMTIRGVQVPGTKTRTASMRGVFGDHSRTAKAEFLSAINGKH